MTRKHNNILRQIGKLGLINPACVALLSAQRRSTHQSASLYNYMSNATTEANQPSTKPKKPRFAKVLPHVIFACNKTKMGALKDIAMYLALHSFKRDWKYNAPHIEETVGLSRHTVTKYLQLLERLDVLRLVRETACRNVKYYVLNHAKYTELFETEPETAAQSPLLLALQLSNQRTSEPAIQLSNEWTASCPTAAIQLSNGGTSVVQPVDNSISRYKVERESKKTHTDRVCVLSNSLSRLANLNAEEVSSTESNPSSAELTPAEPELADQASSANALHSVALYNRFASPKQRQAANGSTFACSELSAKAKADQFLAGVKEHNDNEAAFMCPDNLAELALNYFKSNPSKPAKYLIAVLDGVLNYTFNLPRVEEGYDPQFNIRRSHNLAYFFKHLDHLVCEINQLNQEARFWSLEEQAADGFTGIAA